MAGVYSSQLLEIYISDSESATFVVPDDQVAVIRGIHGNLRTSYESGAQLLWLVNTYAAGEWWAPTNWDSALDWSGRVVAQPGQPITFEFSGPSATFSAIVSGYLLST